MGALGAVLKAVILMFVAAFVLLILAYSGYVMVFVSVTAVVGILSYLYFSGRHPVYEDEDGP